MWKEGGEVGGGAGGGGYKPDTAAGEVTLEVVSVSLQVLCSIPDPAPGPALQRVRGWCVT